MYELGEQMIKRLKSQRHLRIPVFLGDFVQTTKHNWQNFINILLNQTKNIFIIPEVQRPFCNLKEIFINVKNKREKK